MKEEKYKRIVSSLFVIGIFLFFIVILTYPLVFKINTHVPGFFSTDEVYAPLWYSWLTHFSFENNYSISQSNLVAYPFGINFFGSQAIGYIWVVVFSAISILTNHILTYNIQIIYNLFFMAMSVYLLVAYLTKNKFCGFFSGLIFAFSPYIFARSWQHLGETYHWPMPLFLWALIYLKNNDSLKMKVLFVLAFCLTTINFNGLYYTSIVLGVFLMYLFSKWKENKTYLKKICFLMMIAFLVLTPQVFPIFKNIIIKSESKVSAFNEYRRPFEDLFSQSARPLSYFVPAAVHPLFGGLAKKLIGSSMYGDSFTEHTLYLGWTPLLLAFFVFRRWRRGRRRMREERRLTKDARFLNEKHMTGSDTATDEIGKGGRASSIIQITKDDSYYIGFFLLLALAAWLFSQPPWWKIGPVKIFMPSFFMYKILPPFRAYCRFGIVVMLAVAVLAGYGLKYILERFKTTGKKVLMTSLFCGLVLFEFWNYPPLKVIDVSKAPQAYSWLGDQKGEFAIAEYPLDIDLPNEMYKFYQIFHHKPIINGTIPGTEPNVLARKMTDLSDSLIASKLKGMGVKYVFVHQDHYLNTELLEKKKELEAIPSNPGLKFVKTFPSQSCPAGTKCAYKSGQIDVYEIIANPIIPEEILNDKILLNKILNNSLIGSKL
ncbi:MAG: hypothetical protein KKF54_08210 [Candidatus Omnitrophica bacterium]|nr:hypothetical protein [Candidatus Omnitrophota bacterium]